MAYAGWGMNNPAAEQSRSSSLGGAIGFGGGWGGGFGGSNSLQQQQQQDETRFNSLFPVAGLLTGEQVKPVFQASGLPSARLAQIWSNVDQDHDGKINKTQFCSAMAMIRQAQQEKMVTSSLPASAFSGFRGGNNLANSWHLSGLAGATPPSPPARVPMNQGWGVTPPSPSSSSSRGMAGQSWALKPLDKRKYTAEFKSLDVSNTGFISGGDARMILTKSGLDKHILAKIWDLSDLDKDGRLSCDEYIIAMHLMACVKGGASLPTTLPADLYPGPTKFQTVDRLASKAAKPPLERKATIPEQIGGGVKGHNRVPSGGGHTRNSSDGETAITFEDKRKENFEAGRLELERRRKAIKEQQEREAAEKERKKREEEERRLQQEREAEIARQAELERQRKKAMEIELERERQMKKLALQREEEQRELERKRKAEWTKKRYTELEGQRDWEKKSLHSLRIQHSQLEDQLRQIDQKKISVLASTERQKSMSAQIMLDLKTIRLSHDIRRAELTKLHSELNGYHTQLSSLQRQRRELRESLQGRSPEMSLYQQQRQALKDKIIGLAAALAGLRSNISHNSKTSQELMDAFKSNSDLLKDLKENCQLDEGKVQELRHTVLIRQHTFEEAQRVQREEAERQAEEERREREERERVKKEVEERARKEARLMKIKKDQEIALNKAKLEKALSQSQPQASPPVSRTLSSSSSTTSSTTASSSQPQASPPAPIPVSLTSSKPPIITTKPLIKPPIQARPPHLAKSLSPEPTGKSEASTTAEDDQIRRKVLELQKRKKKLQEEKESRAAPSKPMSYTAHKKQESVDKEAKGKGKGSNITTADNKGKALTHQNTTEKEGKAAKGKALTHQDTTEKESKAAKGKAKKDKKGKETTANTLLQPEQLLDLNSSWDSTAQTTPGISSFAKDTSQILQPMRSVVEEEEEGARGEPAPPPIPKKRSSKSPESDPPPLESSRYSVSRLSRLFDQGLSSLDNSGGWSTNIQTTEGNEESPPPSVSSKPPISTTKPLIKPPIQARPPHLTKSPSPEPTGALAKQEENALYSNLNEVTTEPAHAATLTGVKYQVIYDYEANDTSEVSIIEGDVVSSLTVDEVSSGWLMVRKEGGEEGWVPESYLQEIQEGSGVSDGVSDGGVAEETGQVVSGDTQDQSLLPSHVLSPTSVQARVIFSWTGSKDNHLSLERGKVVRVLEQKEKWWSGEFEGKVGWFPKTFVKIIESPPSTQDPVSETTPTGGESQRGAAEGEEVEEGGVKYKAIYEYKGEAEGDLSFQAGDIIKVTASDGDWWTGILNGIEGMFPSNYVQLKQEQSEEYRAPSPSISVTSQVAAGPPPLSPSAFEASTGGPVAATRPLIARVVVTYQSSKPGQLSLDQGDLVKVYKQEGNGWWEGEVQSRGKKRSVGWFPANRVELLPMRRSSTTSSSLSNSGTNPFSSIMEPAFSDEARLGRAKSPLLEVLEDSKSNKSDNLVLALYTYNAQSGDELSFHKGSVISVLEKEGDWWKGEINDKVGLFPSNYVQPLTEQPPSASEPTRWADSVSAEMLASVSEKERKRQEAIFELLTTERHYVDSLKLVKEIFLDPMVQEEILTEEELAKVMVNWDELIQCSSDFLSSFLVRLRTSGEIVRGIGDVLVSQIPKLTPHIRWCSCQLNACLLLQQKASDPRFKEFEQRCFQDPRIGGLPLSSFLLKPMQRVTKYPLLIRRILDYTAPSDSDYSDLKLAQQEAETLCEHVNESVRQKENTEQLEWLQTHIQYNNLEEKLAFNSQTNFMGPRKLLHWGKFFKIRGSKDLVGFLFNDFLLLVRPKLFFPKAATPADLEPWTKNEFQMYRKPYLLDGLKAKSAGEDSVGPLMNLLQTSPEEKDILLRVESVQTRDQWIKKLTKASLDYITTKKKMEREQKEKYIQTLRDNVGQVNVTVVEGVDLMGVDPNGKSDPFCVLKFGDQQEQTTPVIHCNLNPKWNYTMTFAVHDINKDALEITVFDKDLFSPNDFLGCGKILMKDLFRDGDSPWEKTVLLENAQHGEITLKIALTLNKSNLLL